MCCIIYAKMGVIVFMFLYLRIGGIHMNPKRQAMVISHITIPVLLIFVLAYMAFTSSNDLIGMGLIFNSLMIFYPLLFLVQGSICALLRANIFLSLSISTIAFIIVLFIWLNSSALFYVFVYLALGFISYAITRFIQNKRVG